MVDDSEEIRNEISGRITSPEKARDIAGGIRKHGQLRPAGHFARRKDCLASKTLRTVKRRL